MLSTPRSLGFVLAAIVGAMLVPGCRPDEGLSGPSESLEVTSPQFSSSHVLPNESIVVFKSSLPDPAVEARSLVQALGLRDQASRISSVINLPPSFKSQSL